MVSRSFSRINISKYVSLTQSQYGFSQYLQLASVLPLDTNIYGLGEVVASSGFRRKIGPVGGTIQTMWARDVGVVDHVDENV